MRRRVAWILFVVVAAAAFTPREAAALFQFVASASQSAQTVRPGGDRYTLFQVTITNNSLTQRRLMSLRFSNTTTGAGNQGQRDAEFDTLRLVRDDGTFLDFALRPFSPPGTIVFDGFDQAIPGAGGSLTLRVVGDVSLTARDGDRLDLSIPLATSFGFDQNIGFESTSFPLAPSGNFLVDGMVAAQLQVKPVGPGPVLAGSTDRLALQVGVPLNGYWEDDLTRLTVMLDPSATARPGVDITAVRAWADDDEDDAFDPDEDDLLGTMGFTGDRWQLSGLDERVRDKPLSVFFTIDVSDFAEPGRTIRLMVPGPPGTAISMESNNDGPIDGPSGNPFDLVVSDGDRVTATALPLAPATVNPGATAAPLLHFSVRNNYTSARTLVGLGVGQAGRGAGSVAELDAELDAVVLRADADEDNVLDDPSVDPVLGFAFFNGGRADFTGLSLALPAGKLQGLFVTGDVSLMRAADGDTLAARIAAAFDVVFAEPSHVVGRWPLESGSGVAIDGMVAAQLHEAGGSPVTLGPGEGPALALDLLVPRNGYRDDALQRLDLVNLGTAGPSDLGELRLWRDGGDGVFDAGVGDDADLGAFAQQGGGWTRGALAAPLGPAGARLFVGVIAAVTPVDSSTVRLSVPIGGLAVASGNDGPLDKPVERAATILLSDAALLAAIETAPPISAVGQPVTMRMIVRNRGVEIATGVSPTALDLSGDGAFGALTGPSPAAFDLAPGARDTFFWTTTAVTAGEVLISGKASGTGTPSGQTLVSLQTAGTPHRIRAAVGVFSLAATPSLPLSVNRGQADVVPFTLTFNHPGQDGDPALRLLGLRIGLDDGSGGGVTPASLISRVVVSRAGEDLLVDTSIETSGSEIALPLDTPLTIGPQSGASVSVRLDILASTTVPAFRVSIADSAWIQVEDEFGAPSGAQLGSGGFPVVTSLARVVTAATDLRVTAADTTGRRAGPGQDGVRLLGLDLENRGVDGITSDVRIFELAIVLTDTLGVPVVQMTDALERIRLATALQTHATRVVQPADGAGPRLVLNPPLSLPVNTAVRLWVEGDIAPGALPGHFRVAVPDTDAFDARDANTLAPVAIELVPDPPLGGVLRIEAVAETAVVAGEPRFPANTTVGATGVEAMRVRLHHPGPATAARLRLDAITLHVRDEASRPLVPATWLDQVRVLRDGVPIAEVADPPASGSTVTIPLTAAVIDPGDSAEFTIAVDVAPAAPTGFLQLVIFGDGLAAVDDNLGQAAALVLAPGEELPLVTGLTRVDAPARDLEADLESRMPAALAADGREVAAGALTLRNVAPAGAGLIAINHLVLRAWDRDQGDLALGAAVERVRVRLGTTLLAEATAQPTDDTLRVDFPASQSIAAGSAETLELCFTTRTGATGSLRLGLHARDIGVIQPPSAALQIRVAAAPGSTFPLLSESGAFGGQSLSGTWSNFPNPFAAGRQSTTFTFFLEAPARVTLRVFAADGDLVVGLLEGAPRDAGLHQSDVWGGRNGAGATVRNGVYLAELTAAYDDGRRATVRRTVAVVR